MSFEPRIRVRWSPRGDRPWCPGALKPTPEEDLAVSGGWTQFFKRSVVDRLRRGRAGDGLELDETTVESATERDAED